MNIETTNEISNYLFREIMCLLLWHGIRYRYRRFNQTSRDCDSLHLSLNHAKKKKLKEKPLSCDAHQILRKKN